KGQDCKTTWVVQPSDTCNKIVSNTGISQSVLRANNPNINADCFIYSSKK
ncbi:hypothetical protein PILCRDRAFT_79153, partial [Piloderma croceum F 1598]